MLLNDTNLNHLATRDIIVAEGRFLLTDGLTAFAAEVHVIKKAISDALRKRLGEIDIYQDSRSALQTLYSLEPRFKVVAKIRNLV